MSGKLALGYLGVRGDIASWRRFAADIFGLQPVEKDGVLCLRADERAWRIRVEQSDNPGVAFIGFEVQSDTLLDDIVSRLRAAGHETVEDPSLAAERRVGRLVTTADPSGIPIELFVGGMTLSVPFSSPTGARFVTGNSGLGHVLLLVPDLREGLHFFEDLLGLRRSDVVELLPGIDGYFLNGGCRHHIVAVASIPGMTGFDHIYLEVDNMATVGRAWDKVLGGAAPVARSLGQHANDPALSFYVQSPSGFLFEYGYGSTTIDDAENWVQTRWDSGYLWGGTFGSHAASPD